MINSSPQTNPVRSRERGTNSNKRRVSLRIFLRQIEMLQNSQISRRGNMMRLINQDQFETRRIILPQPIAGIDTLHARNSDICRAARVLVRHLDFHALGRVEVLDVARCLLNELAAVRKYESLSRIVCWNRHALDEMAEDDGLAAAGGEGEA